MHNPQYMKKRRGFYAGCTIVNLYYQYGILKESYHEVYRMYSIEDKFSIEPEKVIVENSKLPKRSYPYFTN